MELPEDALVPGDGPGEPETGDDEPDPDEPENGVHGEQIASRHVPDEGTDPRREG